MTDDDRAKCSVHEQRIDTLEHAMFGNGQSGVATEMIQLRTQMGFVLVWLRVCAVAGVGSLLSILGALFVWLVQRGGG